MEAYITLFNLTKRISDQNTNPDIFLRIAKMSEELGELSAACLKIAHYKRRNASIDQIQNNVIEEACDIYLVALDILHKLGVDQGELILRCAEKLPKWEAGIKNFIAETTKEN